MESANSKLWMWARVVSRDRSSSSLRMVRGGASSYGAARDKGVDDSSPRAVEGQDQLSSAQAMEASSPMTAGGNIGHRHQQRPWLQ